MIKKRSTGENSDITDISIPLRFNGEQPNAYGVEPAKAGAFEAIGIIGDTRRGGSVNFEQYTFIPHCNGTHTECVGHITDERLSVIDCLKDVLMPAILVSVEPVKRDETVERAASNADDTDLVITRTAIEERLKNFNVDTHHSLIVRTKPNDDSKLTRRYGTEYIPPYFTVDAMQLIVEYGFTHLLCDLPSIDRIFDEGKLENHRIFWNVEPGSRSVNAETRINSTITELIYVDNDVADGEYMLNLQIAPFASDCSPSRPILLRNC